MKIEELKQNFEMLEDTDEKLSYVIELGKTLPSFPVEKKDEEHSIKGCSASVWFDIVKNDNKYNFLFDSDAIIVKGLLFIISVIFNGKTSDEIKTIDAENLIEEIGLKQLLSNQRQVGVKSVIKRLQDLN